MGLGKKLVVAAGLIGLGSIMVVPVSVGVVGALFSGNSCSAAADTSIANESSLTGMSAKDFLNHYSADSQASKLEIAREIYTYGSERKPAESNLAIITAIAVGIQESKLVNLKVAKDHDSLGVFQQRPSAGWKNPTDVKTATNAFFDAYDRVANPASKSIIQVAIEVQNPSLSAYHSSWQWDKTAAEIFSMVAAPGAKQSCQTGGWQLPLKAKSYSISDVFGMRFDPYYLVTQLHDGVDMAAPEGTPVYAVHSGTVVSAGPNGGFGNYVSLDNGGGVLTGYGHLSRIAPGITKGVQVTGGEVIGYVGSTGASTGDHLHFLLHLDGKPTDPMNYMNGVGVSIKDGAKG